MKKCVSLISLALAFAMSTGAFAMEVPTDTVVQNLNGSQQVIKTFTVAPDEDPQTLIEEPFELEGYLYTFKDITKVENLIDDTKRYTEVVTVETTDDDLSVILEKLMPTIEYDDGQYCNNSTEDVMTITISDKGYFGNVELNTVLEKGQNGSKIYMNSGYYVVCYSFSTRDINTIEGFDKMVSSALAFDK